jgi:hypothetical protein
MEVYTRGKNKGSNKASVFRVVRLAACSFVFSHVRSELGRCRDGRSAAAAGTATGVCDL